jgi:hypothetical protein
MRAKRDWERVRSPHARFLEGLQAAVASHPSASTRGGAIERAARAARPPLTVVGSTTDNNVIPMPTDRVPGLRAPARRKPASKGRTGRGGSPAA